MPRFTMETFGLTRFIKAPPKARADLTELWKLYDVQAKNGDVERMRIRDLIEQRAMNVGEQAGLERALP